MSQPSESTKYKAQVYDLVLHAFFKLREFDSDLLDQPRDKTGWDLAEAIVAAAISGITYKTVSQERRSKAARLLRTLADQVELDAWPAQNGGIKVGLGRGMHGAQISVHLKGWRNLIGARTR